MAAPSDPIPPSTDVLTDEQVAIEFFRRWGVSWDEMCASFQDTFSPDCRWDQRPMAVTHGPRKAIAFLKLARSTMGLATIDVELKSVTTSADGVIHTERVDILRRKDGSEIVSAGVCGVLRMRDGKIETWREYFDPTAFAARAVVNSIVYLVRRAVALGP